VRGVCCVVRCASGSACAVWCTAPLGSARAARHVPAAVHARLDAPATRPAHAPTAAHLHLPHARTHAQRRAGPALPRARQPVDGAVLLCRPAVQPAQGRAAGAGQLRARREAGGQAGVPGQPAGQGRVHQLHCQAAPQPAGGAAQGVGWGGRPDAAAAPVATLARRGGGGGGRGGKWGPRPLALCARAPQPRVPLATPAAHRRRLRAPGARS
jgi:hypothetical protein